MSTFFRQTAQAMTAKHIGRFPLSELDQENSRKPVFGFRMSKEGLFCKGLMPSETPIPPFRRHFAIRAINGPCAPKFYGCR
ncbi:hypothetical protein GAY22_03015 [Neisseria gonorrhoeae]|nr:hypothetical protein GAY22_03015 [Neisseria gonorrhoeae]